MDMVHGQNGDNKTTTKKPSQNGHRWKRLCGVWTLIP